MLPRELVSPIVRSLVPECGGAVALACKELTALCSEELRKTDVLLEIAARRLRKLIGSDVTPSHIYDQRASAIRNRILHADSTPLQRAEVLLHLANGMRGASGQQAAPEGQSETASALVQAAAAADDAPAVAGLLTAVPGCLPVNQLNSLLCSAADSDKPAVVGALLAGGAELQAAEGSDLLWRAYDGDRAGVVRVLLSAGASNDCVRTHGIRYAYIKGRVAMVVALLDAGVPAGVFTGGEAIRDRNIDVLSALLRTGMQLSPGRLTEAAESGWVEGLQLLLAQGGARVTSQSSMDGALREAIKARQYEACKPLLRAGADPKSALFTARNLGDAVVVATLLDAGAAADP